MTPERFQIVLVLNEYGDFLSDMACGLAGSLGIGASANLGFDAAAVVRIALFDAAHGTAPDIAGKNLANPTAIFLALSMLLYQVGEITLGQSLKRATLDLLREGVRTRDLGGGESTESFTEAVATEVVRRMDSREEGRSKSSASGVHPRPGVLSCGPTLFFHPLDARTATPCNTSLILGGEYPPSLPDGSGSMIQRPHRPAVSSP